MKIANIKFLSLLTENFLQTNTSEWISSLYPFCQTNCSLSLFKVNTSTNTFVPSLLVPSRAQILPSVFPDFSCISNLSLSRPSPWPGTTLTHHLKCFLKTDKTKKQTHTHGKQSGGCQKEGVEEWQNRCKQLRDTNFVTE